MKSILNENAFEDEGRKTGYGLWLYLLLFMVAYNGLKAAMELIQNATLDLANLVYSLLVERNSTLKDYAESGKWESLLTNPSCELVNNLS